MSRPTNDPSIVGSHPYSFAIYQPIESESVVELRDRQAVSLT